MGQGWGAVAVESELRKLVKLLEPRFAHGDVDGEHFAPKLCDFAA